MTYIGKGPVPAIKDINKRLNGKGNATYVFTHSFTSKLPITQCMAIIIFLKFPPILS